MQAAEKLLQQKAFSLEACASPSRGSGFRVQDLGFRVQDLGFRVQDLGFRVQDLGFTVQDIGFTVEGLGFGHNDTNPDPGLINPLPSMGFILGILMLRLLKGGGLLIMSLHYDAHDAVSS